MKRPLFYFPLFQADLIIFSLMKIFEVDLYPGGISPAYEYKTQNASESQSLVEISI